MQRQKDITSQLGLPKVAIIVAMTKDRVIGSGGTLPWHLPEDLQLFKRLTMGCTVIMGRKTYLSIGRPLPGRHNIVLSHTLKESAGIKICDSFMKGLNAAARQDRAVFVIGGEELYRKALPIASELHISWIKAEVSGDKYFPAFDPADWTTCVSMDYPEFRYKYYRRNSNR
jgi:dihydrofolate reductase